MAFAFIPLPDLERAFDDLFNEIRNNFNNDMDDVLNYFEDTYIGRARRNGRDNPMFAKELWNMYSRTRNHLPRTNSGQLRHPMFLRDFTASHFKHPIKL